MLTSCKIYHLLYPFAFFAVFHEIEFVLFINIRVPMKIIKLDYYDNYIKQI